MSAVSDRQKHKIALYIGSLRKGGAERVMGNLAEYLWERGWEVVLVTTYFAPPEYVLPHGLWDPETGAPGESGESGIRRIYSEPKEEELRGNRVANFKMRCRTLRDIWEAERPDVILSFLNTCNNMALFTARGLGIPVVVSVRAVPALEYGSAKTRIPAFLLFGSAAGVILQTEEAKAFFPRKIRKRSVILPNPINPAFLRPRYEGEREKTVVCVGRIDKNKNQELLLRAFARCLDRHPEYVLHFYGAGEEEQLKHLAKDLGAEKNTVFHGSVSDIPERIEKAGIFVLPSKTEGMPNALIEAMSLGLACISTDCPCGGPRELIRDGENGFLVPVDDVGAMAEKLLTLMEDPALAERMGREAGRVQEHFAPERVNAGWEAYLLSVLS